MPDFASRRLLIDDSMSLVDPAAGDGVAHDLVSAFGSRSLVRRWRRFGRSLPGPVTRGWLSRLMRAEMRALGDRDLLRWPTPARCLTLFLDPRSTLRAPLSADDVVFCPDVGPITLSSVYAEETVSLYRRAFARLVDVKPGIVFAGDTTRRAFTAAFGDDFRFLRSIPLFGRGTQAGRLEKPVDTVRPPFLLTVGKLDRRQNHRRTIAAYASAAIAAEGVQLVIAGERGDAADEIEQLGARTPGVRVLGAVGDGQLRWLYRHAQAFVLPSLLDGFGTATLDAAAHGLIPLVSRDSALAEVIGELGLPVPADDVAEIAAGMRRLAFLSDDERRIWGRRIAAVASKATRERFIERWRELLQAELESERPPELQTLAAAPLHR